MARISAGANGRAVTADVAGGLDIVFGGIEVFEVRAREPMGWRRVAPAAALAAMLLMCVGAWTREARGGLSPAQVNECIALTVMSAMCALWVVRPVGLVWRFDHKRKTITRRHFVWGFGRHWKSGRVTGISVTTAKGAMGREMVRVELCDANNAALAEVGSWDRARVDLTQIEMVVRDIKRVMWWR